MTGAAGAGDAATGAFTRAGLVGDSARGGLLALVGLLRAARSEPGIPSRVLLSVDAGRVRAHAASVAWRPGRVLFDLAREEVQASVERTPLGPRVTLAIPEGTPITLQGINKGAERVARLLERRA